MDQDQKTDTPAEPAEPAEKAKPAWERRDQFKINDRLREVVLLSKKAAEEEVARLKRQLEKIQYGS